ncbi:DUF998 domain-containing protein [Micromonospora sp. NPDC003241]
MELADGTIRASLAAGMVGTTLFVVTFVLDGLTRPGYRPVRHAVSALALGRRGWLQTTNFVVCGLLVAAAAPGLWASAGGWPSVVVAVFGLALVASGVFPMDPMRGYPPGTPEDTPETLSHSHHLHDYAGAVVFGSLPVAALAAALTLDSVGWALFSGATAGVLVMLTLWFGAAWERDSPRTGLIQRANILVGWLWLAGLCWHLLP